MPKLQLDFDVKEIDVLLRALVTHSDHGTVPEDRGACDALIVRLMRSVENLRRTPL